MLLMNGLFSAETNFTVKEKVWLNLWRLFSMFKLSDVRGPVGFSAAKKSDRQRWSSSQSWRRLRWIWRPDFCRTSRLHSSPIRTLISAFSITSSFYSNRPLTLKKNSGFSIAKKWFLSRFLWLFSRRVHTSLIVNDMNMAPWIRFIDIDKRIIHILLTSGWAGLERARVQGFQKPPPPLFPTQFVWARPLSDGPTCTARLAHPIANANVANV